MILLSTSAYQVWHVAWPAGTPVELSGTLDVQSFCVVEGALRVVDLSDPSAHGRRYEPGSGTVLTTPHALLIADEPGTSAVHVVLHGGAAGTESLPWNVSGRRNRLGGLTRSGWLILSSAEKSGSPERWARDEFRRTGRSNVT